MNQLIPSNFNLTEDQFRTKYNKLIEKKKKWDELGYDKIHIKGLERIISLLLIKYFNLIMINDNLNTNL